MLFRDMASIVFDREDAEEQLLAQALYVQFHLYPFQSAFPYHFDFTMLLSSHFEIITFGKHFSKI